MTGASACGRKSCRWIVPERRIEVRKVTMDTLYLASFASRSAMVDVRAQARLDARASEHGRCCGRHPSETHLKKRADCVIALHDQRFMCATTKVEKCRLPPALSDGDEWCIPPKSADKVQRSSLR